MTWASPIDLAAMGAAATAAQGAHLVLPQDVDVAQYLARMDIVKIVHDLGGTVTGPPISASRSPLPDRLLETRPLSDTRDAERFGSDVFRLVQRAAGPSQASIVHAMLGELLDNAADHARSPIGAFGAAQVHSGATSGHPGIEIAVADWGVGILQSLRLNPEYDHLQTCAQAIQVALHRGVSETNEPARGEGLRHVTHRLRAHGGKLVLRSGDGLGVITPHKRRFMTTATVTPGTWAWLWVDLARSPSASVNVLSLLK
jgi:hypothetical protein